MTTKKKEVSAQVVLKPAGGQASDDVVTSENVHRMMPSADDLQKAESSFKKLGFEVGNAFGNSFSISGSASLFEKVFKIELTQGAKGGQTAARRGGSKGLELPTDVLPREVAHVVATITFSEPPDFGPGNF